MESKRQNDSGIQGESQKYEKFTDFLFLLLKEQGLYVILGLLNKSQRRFTQKSVAFEGQATTQDLIKLR